MHCWVSLLPTLDLWSYLKVEVIFECFLTSALYIQFYFGPSKETESHVGSCASKERQKDGRESEIISMGEES